MALIAMIWQTQISGAYTLFSDMFSKSASELYTDIFRMNGLHLFDQRIDFVYGSSLADTRSFEYSGSKAF